VKATLNGTTTAYIGNYYVSDLRTSLTVLSRESLKTSLTVSASWSIS
jgi:hypothetical protein